jgi:glycosyltransferase involved in cell wall biosynthesis
MSKKISVLTITARDLYLEDQAEALNVQTLQDIEWIVVDANRAYNPELKKKCQFPLVYLQERNPKPYAAAGQAYNYGLIHAQGELVFFMADYVLPHPDCLKRHWEIYQKYEKVFISGRSVRVSCTPAVFESTAGLVTAKDYRMASIGERVPIDTKLWLVKNVMSPAWWSGRNDSAPLEALLEVNGFEEELDGRWGGHDGEIANRFATYGLYYLYDTQSMCIEFEHKSADRENIRTEDAQLDLAVSLVKTKLESKNYKSNLKRDLKKERLDWLKSAQH